MFNQIVNVIGKQQIHLFEVEYGNLFLQLQRFSLYHERTADSNRNSRNTPGFIKTTHA